PVILVAHSYGGFIAHLLAAQDRRVAGMVLVDANIPAFFDPAETEAIVGRYRPQYAALRAQAPALAELLIPIIEAYPKTARRARAVALP
ncbi:alpha/beta fold hydrolase, partial [Clostridium perfringens]